jgi:hypothetical protein
MPRAGDRVVSTRDTDAVARTTHASREPRPAPHPLLNLQRAVGNRAVQGVLKKGRAPAVAAADVKLEAEADDVAARVMRGPVHVTGAAAGSATHGALPSEVRDTLRSSGHPLDTPARALMESRFDRDFSSVRIHSDSGAARSAQAVDARAYTVGSHLVFGAGQYAPASEDGSRLLAHELTHVVQQQGGIAPGLQRKPATQKKTEARFYFTVRVAHQLDAAQLLLEFLKQYARLGSDEEAIALRDREKWHWTLDEGQVATQADVDKGYVLVSVSSNTPPRATPDQQASNARYLAAQTPADQGLVNDTVDTQFWESTRYKPGAKLGSSPDDQRMARLWLAMRDDLLRKRQAADALPPDIQHFLFDETAAKQLTPRELETALRIGTKVSALTPAELDEYRSRVTLTTTDWAVFEAAVDRFIAERKERETTVTERREVERKLFGLGNLFDRYQIYRTLETSNDVLNALESQQQQTGVSEFSGGGRGLGNAIMLAQMRADLDKDCVTAGFPGGLVDFQTYIASYEQLFERETLATAKVMLDQYDHQLWKEQQRYTTTPAADELYDALAKSQARAKYDEANQIRQEHAQVPWTPDEMAEQSYWIGQREAALGTAEKEVATAAAKDPLVTNRDFERERLAHAAKADVKPQMLAYIAARRKDIATTRQNLADKPTMIYGLDQLLKASYVEQGVMPNSLYEKIIQQHIKDVHWSEAIPQIVLAVIAVAAGLFTGGTGTVAVLAAGTTLGISAYQAIEEFRKYEAKSAAYGAKLTSDDPTMAWVIVAVVAAGLDAAVFLSVLPKVTAAAKAFNTGAEAGNIAALETKLKNIAELEDKVRASIIRAAEAELESRAAWKAVFRPPSGLRAVIVPGAEEFGRLVYALYLTAKRGIRQIDVILTTSEFVSLIGDVKLLKPEELALLKTAMGEGFKEIETIALRGKALALTDDQIHGFMQLRARSKSMSVDELVKDMDAFAATKQGGLPQRPLGKGSLIIDENVVIARGKAAADLNAGERAALDRLKTMDTSDLRLPPDVHAKVSGPVEGFNITVARDSAEYKGVFKRLEDAAVGRAKGAEDRRIVADAFFAKTEPGVVPTFVTHDKGIYNPLLVLSGQDPARLGKGVAAAFPNGFSVTVEGRTIIVLPLPPK